MPIEQTVFIRSQMSSDDTRYVKAMTMVLAVLFFTRSISTISSFRTLSELIFYLLTLFARWIRMSAHWKQLTPSKLWHKKINQWSDNENTILV